MFLSLFPFKRKNKTEITGAVVQTAPKNSGGSLFSVNGFDMTQTSAERRLYESLKNSVPIIDAAINKIIRLIGTFKITSKDKSCQTMIDDFMKNVKINGSATGIEGFIYSYMESLLTFGEAVGEMVLSPDCHRVEALYNAGLDDVEILPDSSPLNLIVCRKDICGTTPVRYQELVFASLLNPKNGTIHGTSILSGLPFVSSILLKIFESVKTNWERVGNVRFAVTYNPPDGTTFTEENAKQIADEWSKAMRSESVCDFVSVGDVSVRVIGAENQIPDCDIPIKHILEQIIAKLGIPPFMLGISWSSTERMSEQQADILTSELEYYRNLLNPVITKIIRMVLRLQGYNTAFEIEWENINLQDTIELSQARLNNAQAEKLEQETINSEVKYEQ